MRSTLVDMAKKGLVYGLGSSLNGMVQIVLVPFFITHLSAGEYGRYAIAEMVLNLLLVVLGMGLNVAFLSQYPGVDPAERPELMRSAFCVGLLTIGACGMVYAGVVGIWGSTLLPGLDREYILLVGVIGALETAWAMVATLFRAEGAAWRFIVSTFLQAASGLVVTIVLITRFGYREKGILYGRLTGAAVVSVVLIGYLVRYPPRFNLARARALLRIGVPLVPAILATMWTVMSPRYFLELHGTTADVGVFAMGSKMAGVMALVLVQPFSMVWMAAMPNIARQPDARRIYGRVVTYYVLLGGAMALGIAAMSQQIVPLLKRDRFAVPTSVVVILVLAQVISGLMYSINIGPYVLAKTQRALPAFLTAVVASMLLGFPMTRAWGVEGAGGALLLVYAVQSFMLGRTSQKLYPIDYEWSRLVKVVVALSVAFGLEWFLAGHGSRTVQLASPVLLVLVLGALLVLLRFPDPGEARASRSLLRSLLGARDPRA